MKQEKQEISYAEIKTKSRDIFLSMNKELETLPLEQAIEVLGAVVGLTALAFEREYVVDRSATFKLVQRYGYAVIKQLEQANKDI